MSKETLLINESLHIIEILYRCAGLSIGRKTRTPMQTVTIRCLYLFNFIWVNLDLAGGIFWLYSGIKSGKSFISLTFAAPCITLTFMGNFKSLLLIINEKRVDEIIDNLRYLEVAERSNKRMVEKEAIVAEERRFLHYVIKALNILNLVLVFSFSISPLVQMLAKYLKTKEFQLILPLLIAYPFNSLDIRYWPFVYLHQFWSECMVILGICCADYLLFIVCSYIKIQFRLLQFEFENIVPDLGDNAVCYSVQSGDSEFIKKFEKLIRRHQMIIRTASLLESIFRKIILYNFVSSSILICLTGFNVTAIAEIMDIVTFLIFLFACLLQIFFLCFFGDMLMQSSMALSNGVYNSRWYSTNPVIGKSLLIVLTRAQKPCKLTALGFADVNLKSFTSVLSTSWSYFCLLNTMYDPSQ